MAIKFYCEVNRTSSSLALSHSLALSRTLALSLASGYPPLALLHFSAVVSLSLSGAAASPEVHHGSHMLSTDRVPE